MHACRSTLEDPTSSDFTLATSGVSGAAITTISGSGTSYTVTATTGTGDGTIGLNLTDDDSIINSSSVPLGGVGAANGNFTGQVYTIDKSPPLLNSVSVPANATYTTGQNLNFTVNYSEAVTVNTAGGTPSMPITLNTPGTVQAVYVSGSTTPNLLFRYTVASGDADNNGIQVGAALNLNGGTLADAASNSAGTTLASVGSTTGVLVSGVPLAPSLFATPSNASVALSWTSSSGATSYTVKRSTSSGSGHTTVASGITGTTYADITVTNDTTYYYVVTATNALGESSNSNEATVIPASSPGIIVLSQVYGGGGGSGGAYLRDYVELFNRGGAPVNIAGYSLQYGSSTGTFGGTASQIYTFPAGTTIAAGKYLLVTLGAAGSGAAAITGDLDSTNLSMSATSGKVLLYALSTSVGCGTTPCVLPMQGVLDVVGWGAANNGEGGTTVNNGTGLNSSSGAVRKLNGCQDTNNNNADFTVATTASGLVPRTSASTANICAASGVPTIDAPADPIATVVRDTTPFAVTLTGNDEGGSYTWAATPGTGVSAVDITDGAGTSTATFTVGITGGFTGTATFTASLTNSSNTAAVQAVNIQVNTPGGANNPPIINTPPSPITTVGQGAAPFNVNVSGLDDGGIYNWTTAAGTGVQSATVSAGQGSANATFTVTLTPGFSGSASFTASLSDNVNPAVSKVVTIAVTPPLAAPNTMVISQIYGGGGNGGATYRNDFVELYNPTSTSFDLGGWSIQYASATGTSWQVQPLGGVVAPGEYYLIGLGSNGAIGSALPAANITGEINLSGTQGKVALVLNGDPLTSGCPVSDASLVDLIGYGPGATCREGTANAPAPSNTTSDLRKNGGATDTNNNGSDFEVGAPNPRRTAPIVEIGPYVLSSDPRANGSNAPRDASVIITFTENVDVSAGWYAINCATTGVHNDATVAGGPRSFTIIPNVNFLAGEQCTVTVFKDFVRDQDLDDSAPNTDTLTANKTWTFSVATGTAPPYASNVHLTLGNPSNAETNTAFPNNYLMEKPEFALSYNRDRGTPNWVSWHLSDEWVGSLERFDTFRADPAVLPTWYRVLGTDYSSSGFDRGHMVPNADRDKETSSPINQATFLMTNMLPQAPDNNQGPWANMENYLRTLLSANELYIVAGGAGTGGTGSAGFASTIAGGRVTVPAQTWKVVLVLPKASGNDIERVTASTRTLAVIMPNAQGIRSNPSNPNDWMTYLTSVNQVEALTGYDFFTALPDALESSVEAGIDGSNPAPATNFQLTAPSTATTGTPFTFTVTARTAGNATATTYTGAIRITSTSPGFTPIPYVFTTADAGTKTFTLTLYGSGTQVIRVEDSSSPIVATASVGMNCPVVTVTATSNGSCAGDVRLFANTTAQGATYEWSGPNGFRSSLASPSGIGESGLYTVIVTVAGNCSATASVNVTLSKPTITLQPRSHGVAVGHETELTVTAQGASLQYQWFESTGTVANPIHTPVGTNSPKLVIRMTGNSTRAYWVRVSSSCGSADSEQAVLYPMIPRRRPGWR